MCVATAADAETIARLLAEAFAFYYPLYTPAGFDATTPRADVIAARMAEGRTWIFDGVATLSAFPKGPDLYLRSIAVHPRPRGRRLGSRILEDAAESPHASIH